MKTLFVAWKDPKGPGGWFPVGRLDADVGAERYEFHYVQGARQAAKEHGFLPFDSFPDFDKEYLSAELFPFFANRVQNPSRPSFREYLDRLAMDTGAGVPFDPIEALAISEGRRATDNLEIFPKVERAPEGQFAIKFFLHGWRYISPAATERVMRLQTDEELSVAVETTNPATRFAVQLQTRDRYLIGYAPRYLIHDLIQVILQCDVAARVSRINLPPAPANQRVLVWFDGCWPEGYTPMSGPEFQVLTASTSQERLHAPAVL